MIWCSTKLYFNLLFSTKQEYSPCNYKRSIFMCIYTSFLFINQQSTINSCHSFNVGRVFCFSHRHQGTWCWTQCLVVESPHLLSYTQQDQLCPPASGHIFVPNAFQDSPKCEQDGCTYVPVSVISFQPSQ